MAFNRSSGRICSNGISRYLDSDSKTRDMVYGVRIDGNTVYHDFMNEPPDEGIDLSSMKEYVESHTSSKCTVVMPYSDSPDVVYLVAVTKDIPNGRVTDECSHTLSRIIQTVVDDPSLEPRFMCLSGAALDDDVCVIRERY